jgi:2-polyprenyl-3-methyl-5-hydroxy-6-metoxy-1,4-benzoquinol methylase
MIDSAASKTTQSLIDAILQTNALQKNFLQSSIESLKPTDAALLESYLQYCLDEGKGIDYLAECYNLIVQDTFNSQLYFKRHKKYKFSSYQEVAGLVYDNDQYMSMYMYGLAITAFLWKNHADMKSFFKKSLPLDKTGTYLEIGPGHGFYMMEAMKLSQYNRFLGVDISATSVALTRSILGSKHFGDFANYEIQECDFLAWNTDRQFDAIVMGEVLEHVEQPQIFLEKIAALSNANSHIYITTCINSPAIDHIYLFNDAKEVTDIAEAAGLAVVDELIVPYQNTTLAESQANKLPVNIALVLKKK